MSYSKTCLILKFLSKPILNSAFRKLKWGFLTLIIEFITRFPYSEIQISALHIYIRDCSGFRTISAISNAGNPFQGRGNRENPNSLNKP